MAQYSNVTMFDPTQEAEIKRRRRLAEALQKQGAQKPTEIVGGYAVPQSGLEQLARGLTTGYGAYQEAKADAGEQALQKSRQELLAQAISQMGTDPKAAAGTIMQDPSMLKEGLGLYADTISEERKLANELAKYNLERQQKEEDWNKKTAHDKEMLKLRQGSTEPYIDESGEIVTPLPKLSATEQKAFEDQQQKIGSTEAALENFQAMKEYQNKPMFSGWLAETLTAANRLPIIGDLINDEAASNTSSYQNLVKTGQYKQLSAMFPGAITEGERGALEKLGALASYTPREQAQIVKDAESGLNKLLAKSRERAADIASGQQYRKAVAGQKAKPQGGFAEGATATNPKTGEKMVFSGGQWVKK